jgi:para-aminobenzoate synthetase component 1
LLSFLFNIRLRFISYADPMNYSDIPDFKQKLLQWADTFEVCCFLDSNQYNDPYGKYELIVAAGAHKSISYSEGAAFEALGEFCEYNSQWMFGLFSYDLKNETEELTSEQKDVHDFPSMFFFVPEYLIAIEKDEIKIIKGEADIVDQIIQSELLIDPRQTNVCFTSRISKADYLKKVLEIQRHIKKGNAYEVTFCQEFFAENAIINPLQVYSTLNNLSPTPFAGYFKIYDQYVLSASPERFLRKIGSKLISQPIKGTIKRSQDEEEDQQLKTALRLNKKEQAENVMIVDLVRNDLTKSALKGTVVVEELFGIYSFTNVHQMVSTISCQLNPDVHFVKAIKNTFPMGSMTGAPKVRAMQLIEEIEKVKRGMYSGSMGYISPSGDFDFNVIIRSLLYSRKKEFLSFQVGGAITSGSIPEEEYKESLLKGFAMQKALQGS